MSELINAEFEIKKLGCDYFYEFLELESNVLKMGKNLDDILFNTTVIDIGADCGSSAIFFLKHNVYRVHAFEVNRDLCNKFQSNILPMLKHYSIFYYCEPAKKENIVNIIQYEKGEGRKIFLKIDCEGCEKDIIDEEIIKKIDNGIIAIHDWVEPNKRQDLVLLLKKYEYVPIFITNDGKEIEFMKI